MSPAAAVVCPIPLSRLARLSGWPVTLDKNFHFNVKSIKKPPQGYILLKSSVLFKLGSWGFQGSYNYFLYQFSHTQ